MACTPRVIRLVAMVICTSSTTNNQTSVIIQSTVTATCFTMSVAIKPLSGRNYDVAFYSHNNLCLGLNGHKVRYLDKLWHCPQGHEERAQDNMNHCLYCHVVYVYHNLHHCLCGHKDHGHGNRRHVMTYAMISTATIAVVTTTYVTLSIATRYSK